MEAMRLHDSATLLEEMDEGPQPCAIRALCIDNPRRRRKRSRLRGFRLEGGVDLST